MNPIYKKYKERFILISGRNRSLYLKAIVKKYSYDIGRVMEHRADTDDFLDFLWHHKRRFTLMNEKSAAKLLDKLPKKLESDEDILPLDLESDEKVKPAKNIKDKLSAKLLSEIGSLKYLKREVEELEKETGRYELYIGYPFVIGTLTQDIQLKAPLMLFPAHLDIEKDEATLTLTPNQPVMLNKAL
ncbi:MAG: DUF4011 domain-containing protein, partial [Clostridia bacterium]